MIMIFFFLNQQFITQCAWANCSSYFRNYVQMKHTNREKGKKRTRKEKKRKEKREIRTNRLRKKEKLGSN